MKVCGNCNRGNFRKTKSEKIEEETPVKFREAKLETLGNKKTKK